MKRACSAASLVHALAAQAEGAFVGQADSLVGVADAEERGDGAEQFLRIGRAVCGNIGEYRWGIVIAGPLQIGLPPVSRRAPGRHGFSDLFIQILENLERSQRPKFGRLLHGVADLEGLHSGHEPPLEFVGNLCGDRGIVWRQCRTGRC